MSDAILIELPTNQGNPAETDRLAQSLRSAILEIPEVTAVSAPVAGPAPPGSKAVDAATIGALLVAVQPTAVLLTKVLGVIRGWLDRTGGTMQMTVNGHTIELKPTRKQQDALVARFIEQASLPAQTT